MPTTDVARGVDAADPCGVRNTIWNIDVVARCDAEPSPGAVATLANLLGPGGTFDWCDGELSIGFPVRANGSLEARIVGEWKLRSAFCDAGLARDLPASVAAYAAATASAESVA